MNIYRNHYVAYILTLALPILANAHPLSIVNNTDTPISFTVNYKCSEEIGTLTEVDVKTISEETLNKLCINYSQPCTITAHIGSQCAGSLLGGIVYNTEHNFTVSSAPKTNVSVIAKEDVIIYTSTHKHK